MNLNLNLRSNSIQLYSSFLKNNSQKVINKRIDQEAVLALAGVAQWTQCQLANQRVTSSIPSQGHMPGLPTRSPARGGGHRRQPHTDVSLPLSPSLPL